MGCDFRKGDLSKCVPIIAIGAGLFLIGIVLMIVGIVATFRSSDFVAYVGGVSIFFGILFIFVWHMLTIPNIEDDLFGKETFSEACVPQDIRRSRVSLGCENLGFEREEHNDKTNSLRERSVAGNGGTLKLQSMNENKGYVDLDNGIMEANYAVSDVDVQLGTSSFSS